MYISFCSYRNFNNPYVVKMLGVCIDTDQTCIIMELMPGGDLLRFLRDAKPDYVSRFYNYYSDDYYEGPTVIGPNLADIERTN